MPVYTRTRTRQACNDTVSIATATYGYAPWSKSWQSIIGYAGTKEVIMDNNNRNFAAARKAGLVVLSDVFLQRTTRSSIDGHLSLNFFGAYGYDWSGDVIGVAGGAATQTSTETSEGIALVKAYAKVNKSALLVGESLSDLGRSIEMLRSPFKAATQLLGKMSRYRAAHLGKTVKSANQATANCWLEYRYGWLPLISDAKSAAGAIREYRNRGLTKSKLVARAGSSAKSTLSGSWEPVLSGDNIPSTGEHSSVFTAKLSAGVLYEIANRTISEELENALGLRSRDIPITLWELVPYSFVVDWFTNIGDWIQAIQPNPYVRVLGHWSTSVSTHTTSRSAVVQYPAGTQSSPQMWSGSFGGEIITNFVYQRTCNQPLPFYPSLTIKVPSVTHQVDAAALLLRPVLEGLKSFRH